MLADPAKVTEVQEEIFSNFLSCLGVNRNICKAVQTMPTRYGGLGMFDLNILNLGAKLHFLRAYWGTLTKEGDRLRQMYKAFFMDIGLDGNIFDKNYNALGYLVEHSWFEHMRQLCHKF